MPERRYQAILFDADDTLFDFQQAERHALTEAMAAHGLTFSDERLATYGQINRQLWADREQGRITADALKVERFRRFLNELACGVPPEPFSDTYLQHLSNAAFLVAGARDLVAALHTSYRLALVTNGLAQVQRRRLARSGMAHCFQTVVVSEEVGTAKPDPRIFRVALEHLGNAEAKDALVVGDSLGADITGGAAAGLDTCWYNPSRRANESDVRPTFEVTNLSELLGVL